MRFFFKLLLLFLFLPPEDLYSQSETVTCIDLKNGIFYSYPKNSADQYVNEREGDIQKEVNLINGDTTVWQVKWLNDCSYTLKYISGGNKLPKEAMTFLKKHKLAYSIGKITDDYYLFTGHIDKTSNAAILSDTMWLHEKKNIINNELYKPIRNAAVLKKEHFSDTSKYAVLYVYRPGKMTNSLGNYLIYFDSNLMCVAKNKSGYIFKVLKEGLFEIKSRLHKDESSAKLDIKFGNTYYVKSMIHWGLFKNLYNFKLEMTLVDPRTGKIEFDEVNIQ